VVRDGARGGHHRRRLHGRWCARDRAVGRRERTRERTGWWPANQADRYTDGVAVAVVCVEANGERYLDNGGHSSVVWFRVDGEFAGGEAQGWVPHAATGYAATTSKDPCSGVSASPGQSG
jgi:hypothetical protein